MSWVAIGQLTALLAVFYIPGYMVLRGLRLSHLRSLAAAPAVSASVAASGTLLSRLTGVSWDLAMFLVVSAAAAVTAVLVYRLLRPNQTEQAVRGAANRVSRSTKLLLACALLAAAALNGWVMLAAMGAVDRVNQAWDPTFHLNALRWIKENGQASPWDINPIYASGTGSFYPSGWHALVSLPAGDVVTAANLATLIVACVVWPASLAYMAVALFPERRMTWVLTPIIAVGIIAFPLIQQGRSAQWPNALATALVPAILAMVIELLAPSRQDQDPPADGRRAHRRRSAALQSLAIVLAAAGAAWVHPSALFAVLALGSVYALRSIALGCRAAWWRDRREGIFWAAIAALSAAGAIWFVRTSPTIAGMADNNAASASLPSSVERLFFDLPRSPGDERVELNDYNFWFGPLVVLGALLALKHKRSWPAAGGLAVAVILYIAALHPARPLAGITGLWYHDAVRIAAVSAVVACVLAAHALDQIFDVLVRPVPNDWRPAITAAIATAIVGAVLVSGSFRYESRLEAAAPHYDVRPDEFGRSMLSGEQDFIESFAELLPKDATVIGDPFNGLTFIYALTGRRVVYTQYGYADHTPDKKFLRTHFRHIHRDPEVCAALRRIGAEYVYLGGTERARQFNRYLQWPGFYNVDVSLGFELLGSTDHAALYRITACHEADAAGQPGTLRQNRDMF